VVAQGREDPAFGEQDALLDLRLGERLQLLPVGAISSDSM
jgi:hypothetical protein